MNSLVQYALLATMIASVTLAIQIVKYPTRHGAAGLAALSMQRNIVFQLIHFIAVYGAIGMLVWSAFALTWWICALLFIAISLVIGTLAFHLGRVMPELLVFRARLIAAALGVVTIVTGGLLASAYLA